MWGMGVDLVGRRGGVMWGNVMESRLGGEEGQWWGMGVELVGRRGRGNVGNGVESRWRGEEG